MTKQEFDQTEWSRSSRAELVDGSVVKVSGVSFTERLIDDTKGDKCYSHDKIKRVFKKVV